MKTIKVRNIKTGAEYNLSEKDWDVIVKKKLASRYTILSSKGEPSGNFVPDEVKTDAKGGKKKEGDA